MDRKEIVDVATQLIDAYKDMLILDQFWNFKVEIAEGDFYCETSKDAKSALCWVVKLNPNEHKTIYDVQYSVLESLIKILLEPLNDDAHIKAGIVARLTTSLCNILSDDDEDCEEEEDDD
jgi:hypothetical protein